MTDRSATPVWGPGVTPGEVGSGGYVWAPEPAGPESTRTTPRRSTSRGSISRGSTSRGSISRGTTPGRRDRVVVVAEPTSRAARRGQLAAGLEIALFCFVVLQLGSLTLLWADTEVATPGLDTALRGYAACTILVAILPLVRGRWRALPLGIATLLASVLPPWLDRYLLGSIEPIDLWIGRSMTLSVLFPLVVGTVAVIAELRRPRSA